MSSPSPVDGRLSPLGMVVAVGPDCVIGRDGVLPWRHAGDLRHFRELTSGRTLIVGRSTFETLPSLPGRRLVVVSTTTSPQEDPVREATFVASLGDAVRVARLADRCPIVAGGARIYGTALRFVTDIWWSDIHPAGFEPRRDDVRIGPLDLSAFAVLSFTRLDDEVNVTHLQRQRPGA